MTNNDPKRTLPEPFGNPSETPDSGKRPHLHLQQQLHPSPSTTGNATQQHLAPQAPQALESPYVNLRPHVTVTSLRRKAIMSGERTTLHPPNLAGIRDIALSYGTGYMDAEQQAEVINALFELCDCVEHLHAFAAEVVRLATQAIEEVRSGT